MKVEVGTQILSTGFWIIGVPFELKSSSPTTLNPWTIDMVRRVGGDGGDGGGASRRLRDLSVRSASKPGVKRDPYGRRRRRYPLFGACHAWKAWLSKLHVTCRGLLRQHFDEPGWESHMSLAGLVLQRGWTGLYRQHSTEPGCNKHGLGLEVVDRQDGWPEFLLQQSEEPGLVLHGSGFCVVVGLIQDGCFEL